LRISGPTRRVMAWGWTVYMVGALGLCAATTPVWAACPQGDITGDCVVDLADVAALAEQWLDRPACPDEPGGCADLVPDERIDIDDFTVLAYTWGQISGPVVINEFLASNGSRAPVDPDQGELLDEDGDSSDWIELYNQASVPVRLDGWVLEYYEDPEDVRRWVFPEQTDLAGHGYLVVFASGKDRGDPNEILHTNFRLERDGAFLALIRPDGTTAQAFSGYEFDTDQFGYPEQQRNISYGLLDDALRYFAVPTPGGPNRDSWLGFVGDIEFSHDHGFYDEPFTLYVTCQTEDAQIRYTTDGSNPTEINGVDYDPAVGIRIEGTTPVRAAGFKTGYRPSRTKTATFLFLADIIEQSADGRRPGPSWPPEGWWHDQIINYGMDPEVTGDPRYADLIDDALLAIPSISMTTDPANLFDPATGIYVNARRDGREWERPGSIELIDPNGLAGFQVQCGIRIRGGFSRSGRNPKHAFRLFFRSEYGDANLEYPMFGDEGVTTFDKLDLRTAQNYSWSFRGRWGMDNGSKNTMAREVWSRDTQGAMGQPYTRSRYYHLYINGQYWGLYQTQERPEARYAESYLGGQKDDYDVLKVEAGPYTVNATDGTTDAYERLWQAALDGFTDRDAYYRIQGLNPDGTVNPECERQLDIDNLIDYMAVIYYTGNYDAPLSNFLRNRRPNNYYALFDRNRPDGWKFFCHDAEHSLFLGWDRTGPWTHPDLEKFRYFNPQWLHQRLCENPEYRLRFADRIHRYFFNGGLLTPGPAVERFLRRAGQIETAIIAESARWGDSKVEPPRTKDDDWLPEIYRTIEEYFPYRTQIVLEQLIDRGWYPQTKAPAFYIGTQPQHGGRVYPPDNVLNIDNPNITGTVYYTLDGTDPRFVDPNLPGLYGVDGAMAGSVSVLRTADGGVVYAAGPVEAAPSQPRPLDEGHGGDEEPVYRIAWVTDSSADEGFTDLLEEHGYKVQRFVLTMRGLTLGDQRIGWLNTFDLIIISSTTAEFAYDQPDSWNSIRAPLMLLNAPLARSSRWKWLDTVGAYDEEPKDLWTPVPDHDLFYGVSMTGGDTVNIVTSRMPFANATDAGNGMLLAQRMPESGSPGGDPNDTLAHMWIAMWDPGVEFYAGCGQAAAEARMLFTAGEAYAGDDDAYNLNSSGEQVFLNAVEIMLHYELPAINHTPIVDVGPDRAVMWPNDRIRLDARVRDDGLPVDPGQLTYQWVVTEAPEGAEVIFTDSDTIVDPNAIFSMAGIYTLRLDVSDGEKTGSDSLQVRVTEPVASIELTKSTRVKARTLGEDGTWSALNEATYGVGPVAESLRISEIHFHPETDPNLEFVEVVNVGAETINVHWAAFTEGIRFTFGDLELDPGDRAVVVRHAERFAARYGSGVPVAGVFEGRLDDAGERLVLTDAVGRVIHDFRYRDDWYDLADGEGFSLTLRDPWAADTAAWGRAEAWRPSVFAGGSPGTDDAGLGSEPGDVVINEVLAHSHDEAADWIELHNTTDRSIAIGGWFLSDSNRDDPNRMKFEIPAGTLLPAHGYVVFSEALDFGNPEASGCHIPFALTENGETVYLRSGLDGHGHLTGYFAEQRFDTSATGISLGRHVTSTGAVDFVAMAEPTPGQANSGPRVGPIVISEIYYEPPMGRFYDNDAFEFIELLNIGDAAVALQSYDNELGTDLPWRFTDGIDFTFPLGTVMEPGERIVLVGNRDAFETRFSVPVDTAVFEWDAGQLNNAGETVQLSMAGDRVDLMRYYIPLVRVTYDDEAPWPVFDNRLPELIDQPGLSLHLRQPRQVGQNYGNDPAHWTAAEPTPGR